MTTPKYLLEDGVTLIDQSPATRIGSFYNTHRSIFHVYSVKGLLANTPTRRKTVLYFLLVPKFRSPKP